MKKKLFALLLAGLITIPTVASAQPIDTNHCNHKNDCSHTLTSDVILRTPICPAYEDGHRYYNDVFLRYENVVTTHYEYVDGIPHKCNITTRYAIYRKQCACGYYTPTSTYRKKVDEYHQWA